MPRMWHPRSDPDYKRLGLHNVAPYHVMPDDRRNGLMFMERPLAA
jgi:hypothetical protein